MKLLRWLDPKIILTVVIGILVGRVFYFFMPWLATNDRFLFILPIGLLFLLFLVINPRAALVVILILRPLLDQAMEGTRLAGGGIGVGSIFNFAIILITIILYFQNSSRTSAPKKLSFAWLVFLLLILPSLFYSPYVFRAIRLYLNHITYFSMAMLPFLLIRSKEDFVFWLKVLMFSFILPMGFANYDMVTGGSYYKADSGRRIMGTFTHPNILSFFLLLGFTVYFYVLRARPFVLTPKIKFWLYAGMANITALIVAAKTRSVWLSAFIVYVLFGWLKEKKIILSVVILCCLAAMTPAVQERVMTMFGSGGSENYKGLDSFQWRLQAWGVTLSPIMEKPLHGHGLASFFQLSQKFSIRGEHFGSHNYYLEIWFESGIFALIGYLVLLATFFLAFWRKMKKAVDPQISLLSALMASYVASYILISFSDNMGYYLVFNWYFWFFVGLAMAGLNLDEKELNTK